jgi:hypothetical protein
MKQFYSFVLCVLAYSITLPGCSKSEMKKSEEKPELIKKEYQLQFKSDYWQVYPYIGGPGEDSVYFIKSPLTDNITANVISVEIKQSGTVSGVPEIKDSFPDNGYTYQTNLGPDHVVIWWIQKIPGAQPPADSIFIKYLK